MSKRLRPTQALLLALGLSVFQTTAEAKSNRKKPTKSEPAAAAPATTSSDDSAAASERPSRSRASESSDSDDSNANSAAPAGSGALRSMYQQAVDLERRAHEKMFGTTGGVDPEAMKAAKRAVEAFYKVVEKAGDSNAPEVADVRELAQLSAGWMLYAQGGYLYEKKDQPRDRIFFAKATEEFSKVRRFGRHWAAALFGGAYASFRNAEFGKALGLLQTLRAGFADAPLMPESELLRAYVYYQVCLYDEANAVLDEWRDSYKDINEALKESLEQGNDPEFFSDLITKGESRGVKIPLRLRLGLKAALARPGQKGNPSGSAVREEMVWLKQDLDKFDLQAEKLRSELAEQQRDRLDKGGDIEKHLEKQPLGRPRLARRRMERWSFDGEYWPDELGRYQYVIKNGCIEE